MTYKDLTEATIIADSIWDGVRLTTMRATFPRFILAEFNTHRVFSRNSASSRAIPVHRQIALVDESPFTPQKWPKNQAGMQANGFHSPESGASRAADAIWEEARDNAVEAATKLSEFNIHKQIASRLLEPFMWHTVIVSSTEWDNFFLQRDHEDAQPEMQTLAKAMRKALEASTPLKRTTHVPFDSGYGTRLESAMIRSVAHCARVSYGRELEEKTYEEDVALVTRLWKSGHFSPFEHLGIIRSENGPHLGNFERWSQLRHYIGQCLPSIAARID